MTRYDPHRHHRRSIRLKGYDYAHPGAYFITLCTHERAHLFGTVVNGEMRLNEAGRVAEQGWRDIPAHFPQVKLDAFIIMPNHIHGVLWIGGDLVGAKNFSPLPPPSPRGTSKTIGSVIRGFKIGVTQWFRQNTTINPVWQRNYYEHIIRNERALHAIRRYISENPLRWPLDRYNPNRADEDPLAQEIGNMINNTVGANHDSPLPRDVP
jgi:REP element-mobilizing transposase RayT